MADIPEEAVERRKELLVEAPLYWPTKIVVRRWDEHGEQLPDREYLPEGIAAFVCKFCARPAPGIWGVDRPCSEFPDKNRPKWAQTCQFENRQKLEESLE